ncbi:MAG: serine/threonine-protein kinase [Myxococcaceae bacterium]
MSDHGRYRVLRKIADGGMAEIFLGTQRGAVGFERLVVLKRIRPDFAADEQFRNALIDEAHIAMGLAHSNIAQVLDLGVAGGNTFLVLEFVDGWDLDRILKRAAEAHLPLAPELALHIVIEMCRALGYAHARSRDGKPLGVVHRDVNPHNILVSEQGEVKLTDFGIATARNKRGVSQIGSVKGKIGFMSPEQAAGGTLDARSDLFALGTTLYLMATGKLPFAGESDGKTLALTRKAEFVGPERAFPGIPPEVARLIKRAMKRDPKDRYRSAEEMLQDVEEVQRNALRPAGQTELKRWLAKLAELDGAVPIGKVVPPAPPKDASGPHPVTVDDELVLEVAETTGTHPIIGPAPLPPPEDPSQEEPLADTGAPTEWAETMPGRRWWKRPVMLAAVGACLAAGVWHFGLVERWREPQGGPLGFADAGAEGYAVKENLAGGEPGAALGSGAGIAAAASGDPGSSTAAADGGGQSEPLAAGAVAADGGMQSEAVAAEADGGEASGSLAGAVAQAGGVRSEALGSSAAATDAGARVGASAQDGGGSGGVAVSAPASTAVVSGAMAFPHDAGEPGTVHLYLARREPPPDAGEDVVLVQIASVPSGATVSVNGRSYGQTPFGMRFRALLIH